MSDKEQKQESKQESKQEQNQQVDETRKDNKLCMKLAEAVVENFAELLDTKKYDFEQISVVLDDFVKKIAVPKNREDKAEYERCKKRFTKFLNYNSKFLKNNLTGTSDIVFSDEFYTLFEDGPNSAWNSLQFVVVSYLSFQKQTCTNSDVNYKGMIEKLTSKIEEFAQESEESEDDDLDGMLDDVMSETSEEKQKKVDNLKNTLQNLDLSKLMNTAGTQKGSGSDTKPVIKTMLGDIKNMLSNTDGSQSKNILEMSNDLSSKYQEMITSGKLDVNDLVSGVFGLLNDSSAIDEEFGDFDASKLPDTNKLMDDMSKDPTLKDMMQKMGGANGKMDMGAISSLMSGMMSNDANKSGSSKAGTSAGVGGGLDMGMMSSLMSGLMSGSSLSDKNAPKSISEMEKEIERMMKEVSDMETNKSNKSKKTEKTEKAEKAEKK